MATVASIPIITIRIISTIKIKKKNKTFGICVYSVRVTMIQDSPVINEHLHDIINQLSVWKFKVAKKFSLKKFCTYNFVYLLLASSQCNWLKSGFPGYIYYVWCNMTVRVTSHSGNMSITEDAIQLRGIRKKPETYVAPCKLLSDRTADGNGWDRLQLRINP